MPLRSHKAVNQGRLSKTYAEEAARLRKLALNVTTARLRSRLLEEAANQDWLARQAEGDTSPAASQIGLAVKTDHPAGVMRPPLR
jgi:hypothetical protein